MVATTKVYLFVCFLVLVIGVYFQRVPWEDYDWVYFQGVSWVAYDYFLLVLQWPPSFCNTVKHKCREDVKDFGNFTIHGLWPKKQAGADIDCRKKPGDAFNFTKLKEYIPLIQRMNKYWPNLEAKENDVFWGKQWNKHGKCIDWPRDQNPYFNIACSMKEIASLDETFATNGILKGNSYPIKNYTEAIQKTLGVKPKLRCNNRPSTKDTQVLVEVWLCVHKNGTKFQECGTLDVEDVTLTSCKADSPVSFPTWP